jgi:hypothetical protein
MATGLDHSNCANAKRIRSPNGWEIGQRMRRMRRIGEYTIIIGLARLGMLKRVIVPHL